MQNNRIKLKFIVLGKQYVESVSELFCFVEKHTIKCQISEALYIITSNTSF